MVIGFQKCNWILHIMKHRVGYFLELQLVADEFVWLVQVAFDNPYCFKHWSWTLPISILGNIDILEKPAEWSEEKQWVYKILIILLQTHFIQLFARLIKLMPITCTIRSLLRWLLQMELDVFGLVKIVCSQLQQFLRSYVKELVQMLVPLYCL